MQKSEGDNIEWSDKLPEHMVDNLWISCKKRSQILPPPPVGQIKAQDKSSQAAMSAVFRDWKFKMVDVMVDEDSHSTDLSVSGEEGYLTILSAHYIFWF